MFARAVRRYLPEKIELPVHSDVMLVKEHQRLNPHPGGDGTHIPGFWERVENLW